MQEQAVAWPPEASRVIETSDPIAEPRRRVTVAFSGDLYQALDELSEKRGRTMADVLRDAVSLEKWLYDTRRDGGRIYVERQGKSYEVLLR